jgi:molybdate transport repressor ModE-like protein
MEKRLGFTLVKRQKGGAGGGESSLTLQAETLLEKYDLLQQGFNDLVNSKFMGLDF